MRISDWRSDVGSAEQLGSNTHDHMVPGIGFGALRRGLLCEIDVAPYGQWRQQILDPASALYAAKPDAVLLALDHASLLPELPLSASAGEADGAIEAALAELASLWQMLPDRATEIGRRSWRESVCQAV